MSYEQKIESYRWEKKESNAYNQDLTGNSADNNIIQTIDNQLNLLK